MPLFQNCYTQPLTEGLHVPKAGSSTCLLVKNVLMQRNTQHRSMKMHIIKQKGIIQTLPKDVISLMEDLCISIVIPPEKIIPKLAAFAR